MSLPPQAGPGRRLHTSVRRRRRLACARKFCVIQPTASQKKTK
ncbi:hypothetical protein HMPREF3036_01110 [Sutterella sp. KLE1602]|nr:hypothetical protein HMPREF3036_01110 [Sutterella sp. KLE1602]